LTIFLCKLSSNPIFSFCKNKTDRYLFSLIAKPYSKSRQKIIKQEKLAKKRSFVKLRTYFLFIKNKHSFMKKIQKNLTSLLDTRQHH
jgi:hypothetical protein